jgi:hypothetical protein
LRIYPEKKGKRTMITKYIKIRTHVIKPFNPVLKKISITGFQVQILGLGIGPFMEVNYEIFKV